MFQHMIIVAFHVNLKKVYLGNAVFLKKVRKRVTLDTFGNNMRSDLSKVFFGIALPPSAFLS